MTAFSPHFVDRSNSVYRWLAGNFLLIAATECQFAILCWTTAETLTAFAFTMMNPLILAGLGAGLVEWFGLKRPAWIPLAIVSLSLGYLPSDLLALPQFASGLVCGVLSGKLLAPWTGTALIGT